MEQSLNFEMLRSQWPELAELACMAERYVHSDPESCLVKLRNYTELWYVGYTARNGCLKASKQICMI